MNRSLLSNRSNGFALLICVILLMAGTGAAVMAQTNGNIELNPRHPESYIVQRSDTLWDISALFLRDPWFWPEIWHVNPQVENPHLIYPGDVLNLVYIEGQPKIQLQRSADRASESGGDERLSPRIRTEDLDEAITTIPIDVIGAFLSKGSVLERDEIAKLPYIAAIREGHLAAAAGNDVYVRGDLDGVQEGYSVVHIGEALIDPDDQQIVGYQGIFVGEGIISRTGDPSTLHLVKTQREALQGDRLLKQTFNIPLQFFPKAPDNQIDGRIIHVLGGTSEIGQYHIVVLNRGTKHGLDAGHVLTVWQAGQYIQDRYAGGDRSSKVRLPDEEAGTLMIFKTYDRISYALIMEAVTEIHLLDKVRNPI
jgi:hypothetical protein